MNLAVATLSSQQTSYRRKRGKIATKKIHKKTRLKAKHTLFAFVLLVGFFYGFSRLYLFLITWDKLIIDEVEITCQKQEVQIDFRNFFEERYMGNILLLNIKNLQKILSQHTWVKDVHIRKIFPSTLKIEASERIPIALLEREDYFLIDKDGILLQRISPGDWPDLPLLMDTNRFRRDYERKLALAWACMEDLGPEIRSQIGVMDLTEYENISLRLRNSETWLKLGDSRFKEKIQSYLQNMAFFQTYGPLEYVDFRCEGRYVLRPRSQNKGKSALYPEKEAF